MRITFRSVLISCAIAGVAFACGASADSNFIDGPADLGNDAGHSTANDPGSFTDNVDSGGTNPDTCLHPKTCKDLDVFCGEADDGCGHRLDCGTCDVDAGEICGGGGFSKCGRPDAGGCIPQTCAEQGINCGKATDTCGHEIASCGTCDDNAGEFCGGGGASKCGTGISDPDAGGDGGVVACIPKTCTDIGANCGQQPDGCGNLIPCGDCDTAHGETCGGGGVKSQCGKVCKPITTCPAGMNCGVVSDGCGGVVSCGGSCATGTCGGGGDSNVCGSPTTCTGLCTQQKVCPNGTTTSISGTVTSPNGVLPIYGALVFVPTATPPAFGDRVSCDQCGASAGTPLVSTTTGPDGTFLLPNMPVSDPAKVQNIPVVIQLGRWRKQITVQTTACTTTDIPKVDPADATKFVGGGVRPATDTKSSALPRTKAEGDIPLTAISTGNVDGLECVFRKLGIADSEFTDPKGNGRIRFYQDNGAIISQTAGQCSISGESCDTFGSNCASTCSLSGRTCTNAGSACDNRCSLGGGKCGTPGSACGLFGWGKCEEAGSCVAKGVCTQTSGTPHATDLYNDPDELSKYDMTIFECVGSRSDKTATQQANIRNYANSGGRVYATHYSYVWLYNAGAAPWNSTASWAADSDSWATAIATLDTSFPKGQAFAEWLNIVGGLNAPLPATPKITIDEARHDVNGPVAAGAQQWLYTTTADSPKKASVQHYTFNTDTTKPAAQQCGRVLFSDFHVSTNSTTKDEVFPSECDNDPLTTQEKVLAFMLFDLASCISVAPPPQACKPKTCAEQGIACGQAGDGCGNIITCPNCPNGQSCGGGGTPNQCGVSSCTKAVCPANSCGKIADGCGGTLDCGTCANGTCGGGGQANKCGAGTCTAGSCPAPAVGSACGPVADGCGGLLSCQCPAGSSCINGKCATSSCTPLTCKQVGANCGSVPDGCGNLLDCGTCKAPQSCGGGGLSNVCGGGVN
jgi:hypothetical protein